jgi:hypothetical protein
MGRGVCERRGGVGEGGSGLGWENTLGAASGRARGAIAFLKWRRARRDLAGGGRATVAGRTVGGVELEDHLREVGAVEFARDGEDGGGLARAGGAVEEEVRETIFLGQAGDGVDDVLVRGDVREPRRTILLHPHLILLRVVARDALALVHLALLANLRLVVVNLHEHSLGHVRPRLGATRVADARARKVRKRIGFELVSNSAREGRNVPWMSRARTRVRRRDRDSGERARGALGKHVVFKTKVPKTFVGRAVLPDYLTEHALRERNLQHLGKWAHHDTPSIHPTTANKLEDLFLFLPSPHGTSS